MIQRIDLEIDVVRFEAEFGPPLEGWAIQALVENTSEVRPSVTFTLTDRVGDTRAFSSGTMPWKLMPNEKWVQSVTQEDLPSFLSKKTIDYLATLDLSSPRAPRGMATTVDVSGCVRATESARLTVNDTIHALVRVVRKSMVLKHVQRLMLEWGGEVSENEVIHAWKTAVVSRIHGR